MKRTAGLVLLILLILVTMLIPETAVCASNPDEELNIDATIEPALNPQTIAPDTMVSFQSAETTAFPEEQTSESTDIEAVETEPDPTITPGTELTVSPESTVDPENLPNAFPTTPVLENEITDPQPTEDSSGEPILDSEQPSFGSYRFWIRKRKDNASGETVSGATYQLYSADGGALSLGTTDSGGMICFETNLSAGILLYSHIPYYVQEITAPAGFALNKEQYWLVFCPEESESCEICDGITLTSFNRIRESTEFQTVIEVYDSMLTYVLPSTGGIGIGWYVIGGLALILIGGILMRKRR